MNLISMTDFVLKQKQSSSFKERVFIDTELITLGKIRNYATFLKQPLELWMFIPCDEKGEVLEVPDFISTFKEGHKERFDEYQQAKERCLFEGFEISIRETYKTIKLKDVDFNIFWNKGCELGWYPSIGIKTIEDISKYNLELTPTAQNQLLLEDNAESKKPF